MSYMRGSDSEQASFLPARIEIKKEAPISEPLVSHGVLRSPFFRLVSDLSRDDGDDPQRIGLQDHDFVVIDEIFVSSPLRMDTHDHVRNHHDMDVARDYRADAHIEVHIIDARHVAALQNGRADLRTLLGGQVRRTAAGLLLLSTAWALLLCSTGLLLGAGRLLLLSSARLLSARWLLRLALLCTAWRLRVLALLRTAGLLRLALLRLCTFAAATRAATLLRAPAARSRCRRWATTTTPAAARATTTATTTTGALRGHNTGARQQSGRGHGCY